MLSKDRLALAARAMRCYRDQTYSALELVVVSQGGEAYVHALVRHCAEHGVRNVRFVAADPHLTIGALRNLSLDAARGEIVCQWDDDDCHHPARVSEQYARLTSRGAGACYLSGHLHLMGRRVFWDDWTRNEPREREYRVLPGTVMMVDNAQRYPELGPVADCGEDLSMCAQLYETVPVATVHEMAWLYLYVFHGSNTMSERHHERLTSGRGAGNDVLRAHADQIRSALHYFDVQRPLLVCGPAGVAFRVD